MDTMKSTFDAILAKWSTTPPPTPEQLAEHRRRQDDERRRERVARCAEAWRKLTEPMGSRYADCRLDNFFIAPASPHRKAQEAVLAEIRDYADDIETRMLDGQGLVLLGPSGTGKDHLLTGLARVAVGQELSIKWINGSTLYRTMRDGMGEGEEELVQRYVHPRILYVSDPIPPVGGLTAFQASVLFSIIDGRYRDRKPTWASLNVQDGAEAEQRIGAAIVDRIRDGAVSLRCAWPSYRRGAE